MSAPNLNYTVCPGKLGAHYTKPDGPLNRAVNENRYKTNSAGSFCFCDLIFLLISLRKKLSDLQLIRARHLVVKIL